jgi:hypothetical protein
MESMPHDPSNDEGQLREELVAYLDGELDAEQSRRIEERAAAEPDTRRMLQELDRTWQMLDELDAQPTNEDFTRTTLEMVTLAAVEDGEKAKAQRPWRRLRAGLWAAGGLIAAAAAGFLLVACLVPDPNAQLLQDLPILENFDQYREIDSLDFLRALSNEKRFAEDTDAGVVLVASPGPVETLSQRRRQVEQMSAEQREDLLRSEQQYRALSPQDQQRIRDLHEQLESAPDRDKLRTTMNRYCKWFEAQPPFRRATLMDKKKTLQDRIAMVEELVRRQGPSKDIRLDDRNRRALAAWLDHYTAEHGPRFIESMAPTHPTIVKLPPERQQAVLRELLLRRWQMGGPGGQMQISEPELARLRAGLSPELRAKLEAKTPAEQNRIITEWLRETASHELDEQLASFFESKWIDDEERDRLMALPSDEMYKSLSDQYSAHLRQLKPAERPPRQRGRHPGTWHRPENPDEKGPPPGKDFKGSMQGGRAST